MSSIDKYAKYAKRVKIFNGLEPEQIGEIIKRGELRDYHEGQPIFYQGQMGSNIFVVWKGTVGIYVQNDLIAKCEVGDAFGEMSALGHRTHTGSASALTDVKCFILTEHEVNEILQKRTAVRFLLNIIHVLSNHLELANTRNVQAKKKIHALERQLQAEASSAQSSA